MKTKHIPIGDLEPTYASREVNPNKMSDERFAGLRALMESEGCLQPLLVYPTKVGKSPERWMWKIVDGHHRYWNAIALQFADIDCVVLDSEEKAAALSLAMNRLRGELDLTLSAEIMKDIFIESGWSAEQMSLNTGFTKEEVESLLESAKTIDADLGDMGSVAPPEDDAPPDKPFILEIAFTSKEDMRLVKRKLRKAAGKGGDLATGLLNVLGEDHE